MANKIQVKRGLKANLPTLNVGEFAFCTDTKQVYVGSTQGNTRVDAADAERDAWNAKAPTSHASSATTYGEGDDTNYGHVRLMGKDATSVTPANVTASIGHTYVNVGNTPLNLNDYRAVGEWTFYNVGVSSNFPDGANSPNYQTFYLKVMRMFSNVSLVQILYKRNTTRQWIRYSVGGTANTEPTSWSDWEEYALNSTVSTKLEAMGTELGTHKNTEVIDHPDGSVTTAKLATDSVVTSKIVDGSVTTAKMAQFTANNPTVDSGAVVAGLTSHLNTHTTAIRTLRTSLDTRVSDIQTNLDVKAPIQTMESSSLPAVIGWVRIASATVSNKNVNGMFNVRFSSPGYQDVFTLVASSSYGYGSDIIQLNSSTYARGITQARIVWYGNTSAYLEVYKNIAASGTMNVELTNNILTNNAGWNLITPIAGSVPSGYSDKALTLQRGLVVPYGIANVLMKDNTTAYTPTLDYHPATKKYVDDLARANAGASSSKGTLAISTYDLSGILLGTYDYNGSDDATVIITAALDSLPNNGGRLVFEARRLIIHESIYTSKPNVTFQGSAGSRLWSDRKSYIYVGSYGVTLSNLALDGVTTKLMRTSNSNLMTYFGLSEEAVAEAVQYTSSEDGEDGIDVYGIGTDGLDNAHGIDVDIAGRRPGKIRPSGFTIKDCEFVNGGLKLWGRLFNASIKSNTFKNCEVAIEGRDLHESVIRDNIIEGCETGIILKNPKEITVEDNFITTMGTDGTTMLLKSADSVKVHKNYCRRGLVEINGCKHSSFRDNSYLSGSEMAFMPLYDSEDNEGL